MFYDSAARELELIRAYDMFPPGSVVLCAVSGGADSMYLLENLLELQAAGALRVAAAHYNHRLRGAESERDAAFVQNWCQSRGIPFCLGSGDVRAAAAQRKQGLEETARQMRYGFLYKTALSLGADVIATAHNAEDNAETVLLHLLRGSGLRGLCGIAPRQGKLVRPMLATPRREIEDYLARRRIPHVEDSSNASDAYMRNRVRHRLLPLMEELAPGFAGRLTETLPTLRADDGCLNAQAQAVFRLARRQGEDLVIPADSLAAAPGPVAARAARLLFEEAAEGDSDCAKAHIDAIVSLCRSADPSAQASLPHGLTARRVYGELILTHDRPLPPLEPLVPAAGGTPVPGTGWVLRLEGEPWPGLVVRARQTGDEITLPGRPRRSLKKLFIDQKLPRHERERVPVLADEAGVLAVAGLGPNTAHPRYGTAEFEFLPAGGGENGL